MVLQKAASIADSTDNDTSTTFTSATPPETVVGDLHSLDDDTHNPRASSDIPWPGSTFLIRDISSGHVLTLDHGQVVVTPPGGRGPSVHWACVERNGWLGFRNVASGNFLGHNWTGWLVCAAAQQQGFESFCVRARPDRGFELLMTHWEQLQRVGFHRNQFGEQRLGQGGGTGLTWEFIKVE
jgi:hypothetical protein